jgi:hypothetical protein
MRRNTLVVISIGVAAVVAALLVLHYRTRTAATPRPVPAERDSHERLLPAPPASAPAPSAPGGTGAVEKPPAATSPGAPAPRRRHPAHRRAARLAQAPVPAPVAPPAEELPEVEPEPPPPPLQMPGQVTVRVRNFLGKLYVLTGVAVDLDGTKVYWRTDESGRLGRAGALPTWEWVLPAGHHTVNVELLYHGNGFGPYQYLERYGFTIRREFVFPVKAGRRSDVLVDVVDKGDDRLRLEERPVMHFNTREGPANPMVIQPH